MKFDELNDSDLSENEEKYSNLVDAVSQLDCTRRVKAPTRKELSNVVSEFYLPKPETKQGNVVNVNELAEVLRDKSASHFEIRDKVKSVIKKAKTLPKPLETPVAERIKRSVAYENVKGQLKKWSAVVEKNRVSDHLTFPLKQGRVGLQSSHQFLSKFKPKTPLEVEVAKILGTGTQGATDDEDESNENSQFPLTYEEMMEKKKELARIRAKLSYREAKAHRQSKIKSKKYHRIMKREKVKEQLKEFEQLQKTNPEAALKKLEELDKSRAEERASLRHKNTGKWARNVAVRAKYDAESRKVLAEQLKLSRDLTAKVKKVGSDEEVSEDENPAEKPQDIITTSGDNPWALNMSSEVSDFVSSCKKYWENKNKEKQSKSNSDACAGSQTSADSAKTSKMNGLSERPESSSYVLSVEESNGVIEEIQKDSVESENSPKGGKTNSKEKKIVKNKTQPLSNGQCKKMEDKFVSNVKNTKLEKKKVIEDSKNAKQKVLENNSRGKLKKIKESKEKTGKHAAYKGKVKSKTKIHSTSGSWSVREVNEPTETERQEGKRKNTKDIDDLFEDLDEKLALKASKRLKRLKQKLKDKKREKVEKKEDSDSGEDDGLAFKNQLPSRPEIDEEMAETTGHEPEVEAPVTRALNVEIPENEVAPPEIDPKRFIEVKPKKLNTKLPDNLTGDDNDYMDDEDATQQMNIVEAFGGDDVMDEFEEMKKEEEEKTKLDTDNDLPGWGSWGGTGIKPDERKTKRNMVNVKLPPRKDKNKKDLIITEKTNPKLVEHMVKDVPHPFKSVGAFESSVRHPVGREWIPETAHRNLIKKPVETLLGTIIEPMDEDELLRLKKKEKSLYRGKTIHKK